MQRRGILAGAAAGMVMGMTGARAQAAPPAFVVPPEEAKHQRSFLQWPVSKKVHPARCSAT